MIPASTNSTVGLLLSGGLDSSILLGQLVAQGKRVRPFYIRSQVIWQREELCAVEQFLSALASPQVESLTLLDVPLADLYGNHWSLTGQATPDAASPDTAVYLLGRNALLLLKAALWCRLHGIGQLALAVLRSNPFADATPEFFAEFQSALARATGGPVEFLRPLAALDKRQVMELGRGLPLEKTFSCIRPVDGLHCGRCNKCAERIEAFRSIALADPTRYSEGIRD